MVVLIVSAVKADPDSGGFALDGSQVNGIADAAEMPLSAGKAIAVASVPFQSQLFIVLPRSSSLRKTP